MTSGVAVDEACNAMWEEFHGAKVKTRRVITFRINDKFNKIIPEEEKWQLPMTTGGKNQQGVEETKETIKKLKELIVSEMNDQETPNLPRWIIMYLEYNLTGDDRLTGKECMIKWCPEGVKVKSRMTFASSSKGLTDNLQGFKALVLQIDELDEIDDILLRFQQGKL